MSTFENLGLLPQILKAVSEKGYTVPTPVQLQAIPPVLARHDLLACAQTGTGKTAAFALPILQLLTLNPGRRAPGKYIRALILTPTRELASQIGESFETYGRELAIRSTVVYGGVGQNPQVKAIRNGIDVMVATPGRLLDLMNQGFIWLDGLEFFVLDEADRMLDMGFIHDVKRVISAIPKRRQTLFFSATMPPEINRLADQILHQPVKIAVTPVSSTAEKVSQGVFLVPKNRKTSLLIHLLGDQRVSRALVFTRTKRDANRVAESLVAAGIGAAAIHGNKSQGARESALESIKTGESRVLVATDIAARGIDIDGITHVFNHDVPNIPESYVHRIGRTARAGKGGWALSFCAPEEQGFLADIERLIRKRVTVYKTPENLPPEAKRARGGRKHDYDDPRAARHRSPRGRPSSRR